MSNGYTSNLLCHFVGRSKKTDEERFDLLTLIINGGRLIANIKRPNAPESLFYGGSKCERLGEVFAECDCVCFCDIPNESLGIHTSKYSKFGIGFEKNFVASQGARPVMYVPLNYPIIENTDRDIEHPTSETPRDPREYFPYLMHITGEMIPIMEITLQRANLRRIESLMLPKKLNQPFDKAIWDKVFSNNYNALGYSIIQGVANQSSYVKVFDATLPDDHPDNYYMEREWRCLKNVCFTLEDIKTIYLPSEDYKTRFADAFPTYTGEYYIFDR